MNTLIVLSLVLVIAVVGTVYLLFLIKSHKRDNNGLSSRRFTGVTLNVSVGVRQTINLSVGIKIVLIFDLRALPALFD